ncbi:hypothetical protein IPM62_03170 [Candidatus Woesebacteria bacterium]|nr:MAG: hypothetical protein IPM62_03170 [Candidatus Woesebacteria bacterium]
MKIKESVSVSFAYDSEKQQVFPRWVIWKGKLRPVTKVGLHHTFREGRTLYHVFSVVSKGAYLRLILDTDSLSWKLEEIAERN